MCCLFLVFKAELQESDYIFCTSQTVLLILILAFTHLIITDGFQKYHSVNICESTNNLLISIRYPK